LLGRRALREHAAAAAGEEGGEGEAAGDGTGARELFALDE
jgi:hypothetical protein